MPRASEGQRRYEQAADLRPYLRNAENSRVSKTMDQGASAGDVAADPRQLSVSVAGGDHVWPSARVQRVLGKLMPFVIRVLSYWDHVTTAIDIEGRIVEIDYSGSYYVTDRL